LLAPAVLVLAVLVASMTVARADLRRSSNSLLAQQTQALTAAKLLLVRPRAKVLSQPNDSASTQHCAAPPDNLFEWSRPPFIRLALALRAMLQCTGGARRLRNSRMNYLCHPQTALRDRDRRDKAELPSGNIEI
jgi:hypothetical protein